MFCFGHDEEFASSSGENGACGTSVGEEKREQG